MKEAKTSLSPHIRRLAFIPARGGSKGLPGKNIRELGGKPLIAHTIHAALASKAFDMVLVSTDSQKIADISREAGASVPFLRPSRHAQDTSQIVMARDHALETLAAEGKKFHICAELYPTSPFRTPELLRLLLSKLEQGYASVKTAYCCPLQKKRYYSAPQETPLVPAQPDDMPFSFFFLGLFTGYWLTASRPVWGTHVHTITDPAEKVDIDTPEDFALAQYILENNLFIPAEVAP